MLVVKFFKSQSTAFELQLIREACVVANIPEPKEVTEGIRERSVNYTPVEMPDLKVSGMCDHGHIKFHTPPESNTVVVDIRPLLEDFHSSGLTPDDYIANGSGSHD